MKNKQLINSIFFILFSNLFLFAQAPPRNEIASFDNFEYNNSGNSKMNAYLLAMLSHKMYPRNLLDEGSSASEATALLIDPEQFEIEFKSKLKHWFQTKKKNTQATKKPRSNKKPVVTNVNVRNNFKRISNLNTTLNEPVFDFITSSNEVGYDPEAMIISTKDYIILSWRGTDRVANDKVVTGGAIFKYGEWLQTDFNFPLVNAPRNIQGQVHRGFHESIQEDRMLEKVARRLRQLGIANKKLWITGHSLGGAHAQISALYLKKIHQIQPFAVYTYTSPGVGNNEFNREINRVLPGSKLQRFVFMNDPITRLPTGLTSLTIDYGLTRAGQMNYYSHEAGSGNYFYNKLYRPEYPSTSVCMHNPHWYARAAYFELLDRNPSLRNKLPNAPSVPTEQCQSWDTSAAQGRGSVVQSILGINEDLEPGTYYIMNARTNKFLNLRATDVGKNRKSIQSSSHRNESRFKWRVREVVQHSPTGGYTIGIGSKIIDADRFSVGQQDSEVFTYKREGGLATIDRRNQEWEIERRVDGSYFIKNLKNRRFSLKSKSNGRIVLDDNTNSYSHWFFVKAN